MTAMLRSTKTDEIADRLSHELPGYRVEMLRGRVTATPAPDGPHQETLMDLGAAFRDAGSRKTGLKALPGIGLWLPTGPGDHVIPDLSIVEADYKDALVERNCYAPHVFRLVVEITSSNWGDDLTTKVECYAEAGVPVYVVADRRHGEALLFQDPADGEYRSRSTHKRGTIFALPATVGVSMELSVDRLLDGDGD